MILCYTTSMGLFRPTPVSPEETAQIVERKVSWILAAYRPLEIWLFGSAARGELTEASDVDLAVICEDESATERAREAVYSRRRPDTWPQDVMFFPRDDFYRRAEIGGLPMLIVEDGRRVYPEPEAQT